ncbi:FadR/GntR family transcriptional regulator [Acinetobacter boissieri]|uniref:DNA-binding transcriptional regulator, FadR family n=1 Tax=Acinetobacter boissieri TaxID=1219383 RepID=A0A1G6GIZ7_9GAMM|nr:GntR family transcriptional regulator [Acinetobacter boissieri]SDB81914.1 DNA-binding transcriptional regulator, FadR family [Acinetobacter boissieri]
MIKHAVIFSKLGQATRAEQVVARLSNAIVTGLLEANECLPNESELAKLLGVSHITVREALNTLRNQNLIYTIRGRNGGSFVSDISQQQRQLRDPLTQLSSDYIADLGEIYAAIMVRSIKLAVHRSTLKDINKIKDCLNILKQCTTAELKAQADIRLFLTIAANSQSARLSNTVLELQSEWAPLIAILYVNPKIYKNIVEMYDETLTALQDADENKATQSVDQVIMYLTERLLEIKNNV